ncbi:MAG: hypothetical protein HY531_00790 [Chloroflexi bacterium]|nr:hypothetical protein [Chloroflexota bacterium]
MERAQPFERSAGYFIRGGIAAGVIAGMVMAMFVMVVTVVSGHGLFAVPEMIGQTFLRDRQGPVVVLLGIMGHMMNSAVFGLVWGLVWSKVAKTGVVAVLGGMVYGILIWLVMTYGVVRALDSAVPGPISPVLWILAHVMFGLALGLWPIFASQRFRAAE